MPKNEVVEVKNGSDKRMVCWLGSQLLEEIPLSTLAPLLLLLLEFFETYTRLAGGTPTRT